MYLENAYHYWKNLSFNFEECTRNDEVTQIHNRVENGDGSWSQYDENGDEVSQVLEFIKIPSYVALISDDLSKPVYFVKAETKANCEEIMTYTYGHTLNSGEKYFWGKYLQMVR